MITLPPTGTKAPNAALNTLNRTFLLLALAGFVGSLVMLAKDKKGWQPRHTVARCRPPDGKADWSGTEWCDGG